ncbi:MAG: acyl carrier protein [Deltaproteobacteria bacterium]|nr:acyl carrier protein [Deltaproteobacteria bacterium]
MIKFLKSIFSAKAADASADQVEAAPTPTPTPAGAVAHGEADTAAPSPNASARVRGSTREQILSDLVAQICATMPDPRPAEEIDPRVHMYDAGYVTSITAADLLAHIDARYGVDISETKLIGPLQNLEALVSHIETQST